MKIITIEGLDKSGKFTQSKLLAEALYSMDYNVIQSEFHRYDTPTGKLIMDWLTKKWDVDQYTIELIMTADKQAQQRWFNQLEQEGYDFLILDRYTLSQFVYATANGMDSQWIANLQQYIRRPDLDIIIDIPAEVSMSRKGKHNNGKNDRYESDLEMLKRVRHSYRYFTTSYSAPIRRIIDGTKSIDEVHRAILNAVKEVFDL